MHSPQDHIEQILQSELFNFGVVPWLAGQLRSCEACPYVFLAWPLCNGFSSQNCHPVGTESG